MNIVFKHFFMLRVVLAAYFYSNRENSVAWRKNQQRLPKVWNIYVTHAAQHCAGGLFMLNMEQFSLDLATCIKTHVLLNRNCNFVKIQSSNSFHQNQRKMCTRIIPNRYGGRYPQGGRYFRTTRYGTMKLPFGEQCIEVKYTNHESSEVTLDKNPFFRKQIDTVVFNFHAHSILAFNITFTQFSLSEMCLFDDKSCFWFKDSEYVSVKSAKSMQYFCFKRAQWSIFPGNTFNLSYFLCRKCLRLKSKITYNFQVIDNGVFSTKSAHYKGMFWKGNVDWTVFSYLRNNFHKGNTILPVNEVCIYVNATCEKQINKYKIVVDKLEQLLLTKSSNTVMTAYLLDEYNHDVSVHKIHNKWLKIEAFYCHILLVSHLSFLIKGNLLNFLSYKSNPQPVNKHFQVESSVSTHALLSVGTEWENFHQVNSLQNRENKSNSITVTKLLFTGWASFSCNNGGVSFHEKNGAKSKYVETLSICENISQQETSYVSFSHKILVAMFSFTNTQINMTMHCSTSRCTGVIVNPCLHSVFPPHFQKYILSYYFEQEDIHCIIFQFGLKYLFNGSLNMFPESTVHFRKQSDAYFKVENLEVLSQGCQNRFTIRQTDVGWCGANFTFQQHDDVSKYTRVITNWKSGKQFKRMSYNSTMFLFANKVEMLNIETRLKLKQKYKCEESMKDPSAFARLAIGSLEREREWYRGLQTYSLERHMSENGEKSQSSSATVDFVRHQPVGDSLSLDIYPFSHTFLSLRITPVECKNTFATLPTGRVNLTNMCVRTECLRKEIKGVMDNNMQLEIDLLGTPKYGCQLGSMELKTNLCVDVTLLEEIFLQSYSPAFDPFRFFRICISSRELEREFLHAYQRWTGSLVTDLYLTSQKSLIVDFPGKMMHAQFNTTNTSCCQSRKCELQHRWVSRRQTLFTFKQDHERTLRYFAVSARLKLHPNFTNLVRNQVYAFHSEHKRKRSWIEANKECKKQGRNLPSITSIQDMELLVQYVKNESFAHVFTAIFIGLFKKVRHFEQKLRYLEANLSFVSPCFVFVFEQHNKSLQWSDMKPPGVQMWGPPYSIPQLTGKVLAEKETLYRGKDHFYYPHEVIYPNSRFKCHKLWAKSSKMTNLNFDETAQSALCSFLSFDNMNYPQWHPISCNKRLDVPGLICTSTSNVSVQQKNNRDPQFMSFHERSNRKCDSKYILLAKSCVFLTNQNDTSLRSSEVSLGHVQILLKSFNLMNQAVISFTVVLSSYQSISYKWDNLERTTIQHSHRSRLSGNNFLVFITDFLNSVFESKRREMQLTQCKSGEFVSVAAVNNNVTDCASQDDEKESLCFMGNVSKGVLFCLSECSTPYCKCSKLHFQRVEGGCAPFEKKSNLLLQTSGKRNKVNKTNIQHISHEHLLFHQQGKNSSTQEKEETQELLLTDCTNVELEGLKENIGSNIKTKCSNLDEVPCTYGCSRCFPPHYICICELNPKGKLMHCPSGSHLKDCVNLECNNMFKCHNSYCIPYRYRKTKFF